MLYNQGDRIEIKDMPGLASKHNGIQGTFIRIGNNGYIWAVWDDTNAESMVNKKYIKLARPNKWNSEDNV